MTVSDTLYKAADLIEAAPRLAKGVFLTETADGQTCYCTDGAIMTASWDDNYVEAYKAFAETLPAELHRFTPSYRIHFWNDTKGRTKRQVVAALRRAAAAQ